MPEVVFKTRVRDESIEGENPYRWQDLSSAEVFEGKRVIVFGLPGAFTPICSASHLPGYEALYDEFEGLGVDGVWCVSVNDAFVMNRWATELGASRVRVLPDGNGEFARGMGMLVRKENLGFGMRSWRYSMLVEDGVIRKLFIEPGMADNAEEDPFEVSDAATMLDYLKAQESA